MDVDKLFKLPKIPQSSINKRKWKEPDSIALKAARVEDVEEGDNNAGPSQPSHQEIQNGYSFDEEEEDDEEGGRFFGGGLTVQQQRILELMNTGDGQNEEHDPEQELKLMRKSLLRLERSINKNQEMRVKYSDNPEKFMESETDLNDAIHSLVNITTNPTLLYPEIVKQNTASSLCALLTHENVDIVAAVIELLEEMFDDDVLDAGVEARTEEERNDDLIGQRKGQVAVESVLEALLEQSFIDLLIESLSRFDSQATSKDSSAAAQANSESDASAIFHLLGLIENLISLRPILSEKFFLSKLFDWFLNNVSSKQSYDQNKGYSAELICIILQAGELSDDRLEAFGQRGGVERLLQSLAPLRKRVPPSDGEEGEFVENLFDALCIALTLPKNRIRFQREEGIELMCLIMKSSTGTNKSFVRLRALKVIKYATTGTKGVQNCKRFIECQGLKFLFSTFGNQSSTVQDEENVLEIVMNLLNNLESDSVERTRLISKFVEKDYEKLDRLVEVHLSAKERVEEAEIDQEDLEGDVYMQKLDAGLFTLQLADYNLAWLVMEDDGIQAHVKTIFDRRGSSLDEIVKVLQEYHENVGEEVLIAEAEEKDGQPLRLTDVLVELVNYLLAVYH